MPIDKAALTAYVNELNLSDAVRASLLADLEGDEQRATQFVGQRTRFDDYTRKTQALSNEKRAYEQSLAAYEARLNESNSKIAKIMKDFENERISRATAEARLQSVKTTYELSDDDIPAVSTPAAVTASQTSQPLDTDALYKQFEEKMLSRLAPEMLALPTIAAVQNEINYQHQQLTGKRLTQQEMIDVMNESRQNRIPLQDAWERKYNIPDIRLNKTVEERVAAKLKEAEDARIAANSDAALSAVRTSHVDSTPRVSKVLQHKFDVHGEGNTHTPNQNQSNTTNDAPGPKLSGAERAGLKYIERRSQGIPLGAPVAAPNTNTNAA